MRRPTIRESVYVAAAIVVACGAFLLGRHTAPTHSGTWSDGYAAGYDAGVPVGRALQAGAALPAGTKDVAKQAFQAGYQSGLTDSFGGFDGGWNLGRPYAVVIGKGAGDQTYRIAHRELLEPGISYQLCRHGTAVCRN